MRINDILTESEINELAVIQEGPLGSLAKAVGTGVGKAVGGVAKGVGAVAGGIAGIGSAVKKGFKAGKQAVAGDDEEEDDDIGTAATTPTSTAAPNTTATPTPASTSTAPAAAPAPATPAPNKPIAAGGSNEKLIQVQKAIKNFDDSQKQQIVAMLQSDPKVVAAMKTTPQPKQSLAPSPTVQPTDTEPPQATTGRTQGGGKIAGQLSNSPNAVRRREKRAEKRGATTYNDTVQQKRLTPKGFNQMIGGLTGKQG